MNYSPDAVGVAGLAFFGRISASISHELKNTLAIINESAGLLEDFILLARKGSPVDPDRLLSTAKKIQTQVGRSDLIIQQMNQFSHSVDRPLARIDMRDLLSCLLFITRRITDMKGVTVSYSPGNTPIPVTTAPFYLMMLLWLVLEKAVGQLEKGMTVHCEVTRNDDLLALRIGCKDTLITAPLTGEGEAEVLLISTLEAKVYVSDGEVVITLPAGADS